MFEFQTHPVSGEEYRYRFFRQMRPLDPQQRIIMEFTKECNIDYIYWNGWFYFKTIEDYTTVMLII
jgi:hypothetical protein